MRTTPVPGQASTAIDLTVDVTRGPLVALTFEGDPLPEAARRELVPVREEASVDEDLLEDSRNRITAWLQERGYWRARVSYSRRQTPTGLEVVFTIARGRVYRVRSVLIGGAQALPEASAPAASRDRTGRSVRAVGAGGRDRVDHAGCTRTAVFRRLASSRRSST